MKGAVSKDTCETWNISTVLPVQEMTISISLLKQDFDLKSSGSPLVTS